MGAAGAKAAPSHLKGDGSGYCNNTYGKYIDTRCTNITFENHVTTDGRLCAIMYKTYAHIIICSSCDGLISSDVERMCAIDHSICQISIKYH